MKKKQKLKSEFHQAMLAIYEQAKSELDYNATRFLQVVNDNGGFKAAKIFINSNEFSEGLTRLWEEKRLDLSMEAMIFENSKWHCLFTEEEIFIIEKRLKDLGYR